MWKLAVILAVLFSARPLPADGKFYFRDEVVRADEPYQRALIAHADGEQLLLVQPQIRGEVEDFAWVLPVPAAPQLAAIDADQVDGLFYNLARRTSSEVMHVKDIVVLLLFLLNAGVIAFAFSRRLKWARPLAVRSFVYWSVAFVLSQVIVVHNAGRGVDSEVDVLSSQRVGIYDTQVVRSDDPGAMIAWLTEHGFHFDGEDEDVVRSYVEDCWCFVVARIAAQPAEIEPSTGGLIDPLLLTFPAAEPVYPFALTATYDRETTVLLYVFAPGKVMHSPCCAATPRRRISLAGRRGFCFTASSRLQARRASSRSSRDSSAARTWRET